MWPRSSSNELSRRRLAGAARLLACVAALGVCWLVALPWAADAPAVHEMISRNERLGINPAVKFYSELPMMPRIRQRLKDVQSAAAGPQKPR